MALVAAAFVLLGFSRTYFLKSYFGAPALPSLVHFHGLVFSSWIVLFVAQTALVSRGRTDIHRRLGILGGALAASMMIIGPLTAINAAQLGRTPPGVPPLVFLAIPLFDILVFAVLIIAAFYYRARPDHHKRLMLAATIALLPAAFFRFPFAIVQSNNPMAAFVLMDLFIIAAAIIDTIRNRRFHPAFAWAGVLLIISYPLRIALAGTDTWMTFARWLTAT